MSDKIREIISNREDISLHPLATRSYDKQKSERKEFEEDCPYRTPFQRDRDRIIHSKAFRRLMHKTQAFIRPDSEHLRNRMTHTLEVMQIARTLARAIGANEDLTEAIALGHDLGHTPFGHIGEEVIRKKLYEYIKDENKEINFNHNVQSWRIVTYLEKYFRFLEGLNLTKAVSFGILRHSGKYKNGEEKIEVWDKEGKKFIIEFPQTLEEKIVRIADDIAWINHDWDDGKRGGLLTDSLLGIELIRNLGIHQSIRINKMVKDVIETFEKHG
ncbi:MAG: dNTP triphosphohydrolase [Candidatus Aenigmatarchaeota archaeon]